MKPVKHILNEVWDQYPETIANSHKAVDVPKLERILADVFTSGKYYFYVMDIVNSTLSNFHPAILDIHDLKEYPVHLKEIIDLIHPDDLFFVMEAERWAFKKINEIGTEHLLNLKSGYCFRMKTGDDNYELFHHQTIHTAKDDSDRLLQSINIHTNINHITTTNNYIITVSGIGFRKDFHQKAFQLEESENRLNEHLTKRETEILKLITKNHSDKEIAEILCISYHTVRTHHKSILKKTKSKNSFELLKKSLENGYL